MKEKLIEEMAKVIHESDKIDNNILPSSLADCVIKHGGTRTNEAVALYEAGYRKQSEGEWVIQFLYGYNYDDYYYLTCSKCGASFRDIHAAAIPKIYRYCSVCGAKMKGGEG